MQRGNWSHLRCHQHLRKLIVALLSICFWTQVSGQQPVHLGLYEKSVVMPVGDEVSIVAVGDLMLGSWVVEVLEKHGIDYPFRGTRHYLRSAHATIANLEAPFTEEGEPFEKKFNFMVPPRFAAGLPANGINVVNLANNHTLDYGLTGLSATLRALQENGVAHCGAGMDEAAAHRPTIVKANGLGIAFFGYNMTYPLEFFAKADTGGTAYPGPDRMQSTIRAWRDSVDFIVASFHWGAEKRETPKDYQIQFAHMAIDSGADLVLGHHPHVLQGLELYKNRLIAYSLGNFAFGSYSQYATDSIILKIYLKKDGLFVAYCTPLNVDNHIVEFQPLLADSAQARAIISKLQQLSRPLNGGRDIIDTSGLIYGDWAYFYDGWLMSSAIDSYWNAPSLSTEIERDSTETMARRAGLNSLE